jgi:hypothetical protein
VTAGLLHKALAEGGVEGKTVITVLYGHDAGIAHVGDVHQLLVRVRAQMKGQAKADGAFARAAGSGAVQDAQNVGQAMIENDETVVAGVAAPDFLMVVHAQADGRVEGEVDGSRARIVLVF